MNAGRSRAAHAWPRSLRLIRTKDFGVVVHARSADVVRLQTRFFSAVCMPRTDAGDSRLRIGVTVGKRLAARSVDRATVKRILREASRHMAPELLDVLERRGAAFDLSLRLKAPIKAAGERSAFGALKKTLREDADYLWKRVLGRLSESSGGLS